MRVVKATTESEDEVAFVMKLKSVSKSIEAPIMTV